MMKKKKRIKQFQYNEISTSNIQKDLSFKKVKLRSFTNSNNYKLFNNKIIFISSISILLLIIIIQINFNKKCKYNLSRLEQNKRKYDINFNYVDFDKEIITEKILKDSGWILGLNDAKFINGIIRKNKPKNCLEIGVARGGSSILILNAIKDIENSLLVSMDLNKELYFDPNTLTGYRVKKYFPELTKNWKLYTGDQPHKFLVELNIKFDFLFLDSAHVSPGEILNFIEALPFLNENAIVVIHDILWHFTNVINSKFFPSCISLIPVLYGDKIFVNKKKNEISNIGAVFLYPNQNEHYLDYFLLLLNFWEYMPKTNQIDDLRVFIKQFYKKDIYINIFNKAVSLNKEANLKFKKYTNIAEQRKYLVSLGTKWKINE